MYGYNPVDSGETGEKDAYSVEFAQKEVRHGFIRKVFGILAVQLLMTAVTAAFFVLNSAAEKFVINNVWTLYVAMGVTLAIALAIGCCEGPRKSFPTNYILLFVFTAAESFLVGVISATYETNIVLLAFGLTSIVTIGLTLFACQTKWDFTVCGGMLFGLVFCLIGAGLIMSFFPRTTVGSIAISSAGALIFAGYLVYDVQLLMGGRKHEYGPDDYVAVALSLYLDIINLFLYLLELLSAVSGNRN